MAVLVPLAVVKSVRLGSTTIYPPTVLWLTALPELTATKPEELNVALAPLVLGTKPPTPRLTAIGDAVCLPPVGLVGEALFSILNHTSLDPSTYGLAGEAKAPRLIAVAPA